MGMEEDLFNTFKYTSFSSKASSTRLVQAFLRNMEVRMLKQMMKGINERLTLLQDDIQDEGAPYNSAQYDDVHAPAANEPLDPFNILGVTFDSTKDEVCRAYRERAKASHPDAGGSNEEMAKVNAAFEAIRIFKGWR